MGVRAVMLVARSLCAVCERVVHTARSLWCVCLTYLFGDRGVVRSHFLALREASRPRSPTLRDSVTPLPLSLLTTNHGGSGRVIPERSLSSPCREKETLLWAAVSLESLPRPTRHSLGALRGVHRGTPRYRVRDSNFFRCLHGSSDHKDSGTQTGPPDPESPEDGRGTASSVHRQGDRHSCHQ